MRKRKGEEHITLEYLEQINKYYGQMIKIDPEKVIVVDTNNKNSDEVFSIVINEIKKEDKIWKISVILIKLLFEILDFLVLCIKYLYEKDKYFLKTQKIGKYL